jgi:hypothetical protein
MNRATSLTVIAIGAILAFAVSASPSFLNLQIVGWILMATGAAGLLLERRGRDWLRRTVIVRGSPDVPRFGRRRPAQITARPPADQANQAHPANPENPAGPAEPTEPAPADGSTQPIGEPVERETIEEYIEQ